jgi:hypothetical protein
MNKQTGKILTMVAGVITALVVVFSQVFYFQAPAYAKKEVKTGHEKKEKQSEQKDKRQFLSLPSISQPTASTNVEADHESAFLLEILFEDKAEPADHTAIPRSLGKLFHTLFRVIISPNAP